MRCKNERQLDCWLLSKEIDHEYQAREKVDREDSHEQKVMPAPNAAALKPTLSNNATNKTREYEVLVIPPASPTSDTYTATQQPLRTRTKRINCNSTNGTFYWIPEGYRAVLVRTADLPLLVGSEYPLPSPTYSSDSEDSSC
ncbi:4309_t:CDS:2 [Acaulospora colombiana]|uniref:4309_t:CDS:1 n=1 Tax=Acaulospora colombiana TaxID=27376 RepID=A0ACA9KTF9_9GLOM|nr:4309_t:CDS:2 [Acaulospora colombiana]